MFKNPSFLFDIVCTVVWLLLAVRYARKGFLAASVQLGGNVFSLVGARVFSGWAAVEVFQRFLAGSFRTQIAESISAGGVVDLTGINDAMVADAPTPEEAIRAFKEFCGDNILVAHNAHSFDMLFIRKAGEKAGVSWDENTYIDTLPMGQALFPGLRNYKLDTINKHLEIPPFNHHRAVDDAMALARIYEVMLTDLAEKDIHTVESINTGLGGNKEVLKKKYYHLIILVQNQVGLKNLYRIVSAAHTQ